MGTPLFLTHRDAMYDFGKVLEYTGSLIVLMMMMMMMMLMIMA